MDAAGRHCGEEWQRKLLKESVCLTIQYLSIFNNIFLLGIIKPVALSLIVYLCNVIDCVSLSSRRSKFSNSTTHTPKSARGAHYHLERYGASFVFSMPRAYVPRFHETVLLDSFT